MGVQTSRDASFARLDEGVRKWVYKKGWTELRDIQIEAIDPILDADSDLVISAPTSSGKSEAVFLPACSVIANQKSGIGILYISPLKALINDQYRRLESLCTPLGIPITAWHGDSSQSAKKRIRKTPGGIILITPESLESLLILKADWVVDAFSNLKYVIIDEYHSFLNSVRGYQLRSLLHRLEVLLQCEAPIPRLALSATLGDMESVMESLRPGGSFPCRLIEGLGTGVDPTISIEVYTSPNFGGAERKITKRLYESLRGDSHLVFANSRKSIEIYSVHLAEMCERHHVPNEFFPHHGSLSQSIRGDLEKRLQKEDLPTTAICSTTLELGIDVGKVNTVCQLSAPHSVASLRQRLGRSGRRGEAAVLNMYISEREVEKKQSLGDALHLELVQSMAMVKLLLIDQWFEPPDKECFHFSTLVHQILALIAQWGGVRADQLWHLLVESGSFPKVEVSHFRVLLRGMGEGNLIHQLGSDVLVLASVGERIVNHFSFYAVFKTPPELNLMTGDMLLGKILYSRFLKKSKYLIFAGKKWEILDYQKRKKTIYVIPAGAGRVPKFGGGPMRVHEKVRREMFAILAGQRAAELDRILPLLGENATLCFQEARNCFRERELIDRRLVKVSKGKTILLTWSGDKVARTILYLLIHHKCDATLSSGVIYINRSPKKVRKLLNEISESKKLSVLLLAEEESPGVKAEQKYDEFLPAELLNLGFAARSFDLPGALTWIRSHF